MREGIVKVLVVDDTSVTRLLMTHVLESDPQVRVVGAVADGHAALEFVEQCRPDVVLMDIHMPGIDGFEATRRIMESRPVPIVICSATVNPRDVATSFRLLEAGAVAFVEKPVGPDHPGYASRVAHLLEMVKVMSEVRVIRRWPKLRGAVPAPVVNAAVDRAAARIQFVGIGASTGGPPVLQTLLAGLPPKFPATVLIVQHIAHGFLPGMVEWLAQSSALPVHIASHGLVPEAGHVYLAPDDFHLGVGPGQRLMLSRGASENSVRPAVSFLFRSLADLCGSTAVGVLLSGMGKDGAAELKRMRDAGAITIIQDRKTSVVYGMPGEAVELDAGTYILPADRIAGALATIVNHRPGPQPIES